MAVLRSLYFATNLRLNAAAAGGRPVAQGESSGGVALMQAALADLGFKLPDSMRADRAMDGVFGAETLRVVKDLQQREKLKMDGIAGPKTLIRLDRLLAGVLPSPRPNNQKKRAQRPPAPKPTPPPPPGPNPAPGPGPAPPPAPRPFVVDDPFYKLGSDDPPLAHDPGAGPWGAKGTDFSTFAQRELIRQVLGPAMVYPGPNAVRHMIHYFNNTGSPLTINLEDMIESVPTAKTALVNEFRQAQRFIQRLPIGTHAFTAKTGESWYNYKQESADWFFAIGGYTCWGKGNATVGVGPGGQRRYDVEFLYNFYDRYNWDGGKKVTIGGIEVTDEFMGEFHRQGIAREYDCKGVVRRRFSWVGDVVGPDEQTILRPGR